MRFVLLGIVLVAGILFAFQTHAVRGILMQVKSTGGAVASRIVGDLAR